MSLNLICTQLWYFDGKNHYIIQNINNINNINIELIFFEAFLRKRGIFPRLTFRKSMGIPTIGPPFRLLMEVVMQAMAYQCRTGVEDGRGVFQQAWLEDVGKYTIPYGPMEQQHMLQFFQSSKPVIKISNFFYSTSKMDPEESQIVKKEKCIPTILEFHSSFRRCSLGKISPSLVSCVEKREEFMILPVGAGSFREALQIGAEVAICTNYSINDWTTSAIFRGIFE